MRGTLSQLFNRYLQRWAQPQRTMGITVPWCSLTPGGWIRGTPPQKGCWDCLGTSSRLLRSVTSFSSPDSPPEPGALWLSASSGGLDSLLQLVDLCPHFLDNSHEMVIRAIASFQVALVAPLGRQANIWYINQTKTICLVERVDPTPKVSWTTDVCLLYAIFQHLGS